MHEYSSLDLNILDDKVDEFNRIEPYILQINNNFPLVSIMIKPKTFLM